MFSENKSHHANDGFRNPFPGFEERGFGDFLKWQIVERIKNKKPDKPDNYVFDIVENDGSLLQWNDSSFSVTWIGHSTCLIQFAGLNILTDPVWSERASPVGYAGPKRYVEPGIAFENLPAIDLVLISHDHYDHLDKETIKRLGSRPFYLAPLGLGKYLRNWGVSRFEELDWWDSIKFNGIEFICTPAQHFSGRSMFSRNKTLWCGWIGRNGNSRFYFAGDSGYFPGFKEIGQKYGPFDLAAIPIGAYLPRWFMSPLHVNPAEAVQAFLDVNGGIFVPIHWGTFDLADEPLDQPPLLLKSEIRKRGLDEEKFKILAHGETLEITAKGMDETVVQTAVSQAE